MTKTSPSGSPKKSDKDLFHGYEYPHSLAIGLGPGQFSSRASAISAGYLGQIPPPFKFVLTEAFRDYALDMWLRYNNQTKVGAFEAPASSWTGVISEFGIIGFLLVSACIGRMLLRTRAAAVSADKRLLGFFFSIGVLTIYGAGAIEYYWEVPQTIFLGCLLLKVMHAMMMHTKDEQGGSSGEGLAETA